MSATRSWSGAGDGRNWFDKNNWSPSDNYPQANDDVTLSGTTSAALTNATAQLHSLTINNATLTVSNWFAEIRADTVAIQSMGIITLPPAFADGVMSNRVSIIADTFQLEAGGQINTDAKGFLPANGPAKGAQSGSNNNGGGGHGGRGGDENGGSGGPETGLADMPETPGSGGGRWTSSAYPTPYGCGGGVVRIQANTVVINGLISCNGSVGQPYDGGGAGGAVWIACSTFSGNGVIHADGGEGGVYYGGGGGGGGRIAVDYSTLAGGCSVFFSTTPGFLFSSLPAGMGTLYLSKTNLLTSERLASCFNNVRIFSPGWNEFNLPNLAIIGNAVCFGEKGFTLNIENDLTLQSNAWLIVGAKALSSWQADGSLSDAATNPAIKIGGNLLLQGSALTVGGLGNQALAELVVNGSMILTNAGAGMQGRLYVYAGITNALRNAGALVKVDGDCTIASNAFYYPISHPTNGGSPMLIAHETTIFSGGGVVADAFGFRSYPAINFGPGKGSSAGDRASGGGYGGQGGRCISGAPVGPTYGETNRPLHPGSAGGVGYTPQPGYGHGGGAIWIQTGGMIMNGMLSANGQNAGSSYGGAGSGGGIFVLADSFSGTPDAIIRANGGNANTNLAGGGGGGRIAVAVGMTPALRAKLVAGQEVEGLFAYPSHSAYAGGLSVKNGIGWGNGDPGTATFLTSMAGKFSLGVLGDPDIYDTPAPFFYGVTIGISGGTMITNTVASPANELAGTRRSCIGWRLHDDMGTLLAENASTQAVFQLSTNMYLTFRWTNEYLLNAQPGPNGTVNVAAVNGWYTNGLVAAGILAVPNPGYAFLRWTGNLPTEDMTNNPLSLTMDQPRTILANFHSLAGGIKRWNGIGDWDDPDKWAPSGMPGPLDDAIIATGNALLSQTRTVRSLVVSNNATVTFTNRTTALNATHDIVMRSGSTITLTPPFRYPSEPSNRIWIVCRNFTMEPNALIDATAKGYYTQTGPGKGTGYGSNDGSGGGHGGRGGYSASYPGGLAYDIANAPQLPGSGGGGGYTDVGGHGGGVIFIDASGEVTINGIIQADGQSGATYNGGGAGGSIFIISQTFRGGSTASMTAKGGGRGTGYPTILGGGGGGRIAIWHGDRSETDRAKLMAGQYVKALVVSSAHPDYTGVVSVEEGLHNNVHIGPEPGTIVFLSKYQAGTVLSVY